MHLFELNWQQSGTNGAKATINEDYVIWRNRDGAYDIIAPYYGFAMYDLSALEAQLVINELLREVTSDEPL